ncbi:peptidase S41 family protein [Tanacetum coccineum]
MTIVIASTMVMTNVPDLTLPQIRCVQGQNLWRNSESNINNELYAGYKKGNTEEKINEILAGVKCFSFDSATNSLSDQPVDKHGTGDDLPYRMVVHPGGDGVICLLPQSCSARALWCRILVHKWYEWDANKKDDRIKLSLKPSEKLLDLLQDVGQQLAITFSHDGSLLAVGGEHDVSSCRLTPEASLLIMHEVEVVEVLKNVQRFLICATLIYLLFLEAWRTIDRAYVDKGFNGQSWFRYRENALRNEPMNNHAAIKKMLATLDDPFTCFLEREKFKLGTQGALTGVGLSIGYPTENDGALSGLIVISVSPGGPATRAAISLGDLIISINDTSTETTDIYDAAECLQCENISLNPVKSRSVRHLVSERNYSIKKSVPAAVKEAIETLRRENVDSFVLDLRNNSGGLFPEGIEIAMIWYSRGCLDAHLESDLNNQNQIISCYKAGIGDCTLMCGLIGVPQSPMHTLAIRKRDDAKEDG